MKTQVVRVLAMPDKHSLVFAITLADALKRLFSLREVLQRPKLGLEASKPSEPSRVAAQLLKEEAFLMIELGGLVNRLCTSSLSAQKQAVQSLALPLATYLLTDFLPSASGLVDANTIHGVELTIKLLATESLLRAEILKQLEPTDIDRVLRCYFRLQKQLTST